LQLSEIHRRVCERRAAVRRTGAGPHHGTSSQLKSLAEKKLIGAATPAPAPRPAVRTRGGYTPPTRASASSYRALHGPGEVLLTTFRGLAAAYPEEQRLQAVLDVARALGVSRECLRSLHEIVEREKGGNRSGTEMMPGHGGEVAHVGCDL